MFHLLHQKLSEIELEEVDNLQGQCSLIIGHLLEVKRFLINRLNQDGSEGDDTDIKLQLKLVLSDLKDLSHGAKKVLVKELRRG